MTESVTRIKELVSLIRKADKAYHDDDTEIMSNYDYDKLYDELVALEAETGIILAGSPTQKVGYEVVSKLPKETHQTPMLSLNKTKDIDALASFLGSHNGILSWKLDGLTVVLTYNNGQLEKAVTRGNGTVGEVITNNARTFEGVPLTIAYQGELVVRGEALISYSNFEKINARIPDEGAKYKNPRNLCSGSVRQLDSAEAAKRHIEFVAFALVFGGPDCTVRHEELAWLAYHGFSVVEHTVVEPELLSGSIATFASKIPTNDFPSDGLVLQFDDITYGISLGQTSKFPKDAMAYKWADEAGETTLREIEWSPSRTGLITPVAIFDPVELEGTTVSRASVHNISIMEELELGIGDSITVYKANMIIPKIADNLTRSGTCDIPGICPVCGYITQVHQQNDAKMLYCTNPACSAKQVGMFEHFVKRDAMNIDGLSEATLEKLIGAGFIKSFASIYRLSIYENEITSMEGFGERSYEKLIASIDASRQVTLPKLIYALGITNVGRTASKLICQTFKYDVVKVITASQDDLLKIPDIGETIATSFTEYFKNTNTQQEFDDLLSELIIEVPAQPAPTSEGASLSGQVFVVTGSVEHFKNRDEIKELIESLGGKVTGSVTAKTNYLINNDVNSSSSKNKKAKDLGIPIISETEFLALTQ